VAATETRILIGIDPADPVIDQAISGVGTDERPMINKSKWTNIAFE
jgi:hypothetical protein